MTEQERREVALSAEDRQRMRRLSEEIEGRLTEMALVLTRTLDQDFGATPLVQYRPEPDRAEGPTGQHIQLVCTPDGAVCGCYVEPPGICVMGSAGVGC